jgi:Icc-related predicted phosphoesterase
MKIKKKIVCVSDIHNDFNFMISDCDILLIAGDFSSFGRRDETERFFKWLSKQPAKHKVFICGNHEIGWQQEPSYFQGFVDEMENVYHLKHNSVEIDGVKIFGSPFTPQFGRWAFMYQEEIGRNIWEAIPENVDFLLTHGPCYGILDEVVRGEKAGCPYLLREVQKKKPKYHIFGHIHESYGIFDGGYTTFINCSRMNERYLPVNGNIEIDFIKEF